MVRAQPGGQPGGLSGASIADDPATRQTLLFNGNANGTAQAGTWTWSGTTWTEVSPTTSPSARYNAALACLLHPDHRHHTGRIGRHGRCHGRHPAGTSATGSADQFSYQAFPVVSAVSPVPGLPAGGASVVITGSGFSTATGVKFGVTSATSSHVDSFTQITAVDPVEVAGTVDVTVINPYGTSVTSSADEFAYEVAPTVTAVSPATGLTTGAPRWRSPRHGLRPSLGRRGQLPHRRRLPGKCVRPSATGGARLLVKAASSTDLNLSATELIYGDEQVEHVSVGISSPAPGSQPSGSVTISESGITLCTIKLSTGTASCRLSAKQLPVDAYSVVASYGGSGSSDPPPRATRSGSSPNPPPAEAPDERSRGPAPSRRPLGGPGARPSATSRP